MSISTHDDSFDRRHSHSEEVDTPVYWENSEYYSGTQVDVGSGGRHAEMG